MFYLLGTTDVDLYTLIKESKNTIINFKLYLQITPSLPTPATPDPQKSGLEKLFIDIAGTDMEVDWMELKRILDHSMKDGMYLNDCNTVINIFA